MNAKYFLKLSAIRFNLGFLNSFVGRDLEELWYWFAIFINNSSFDDGGLARKTVFVLTQSVNTSDRTKLDSVF